MKRMPLLLAVGFVLITFFRVSAFLFTGMRLGWLGFSFALALTLGVYVTAYFIRFRETKWIAIAALAIFTSADLWFNEFEMVRSLSPEQLLGVSANFLGFNSESITWGLHLSALIYGALPTTCAVLLGVLQSRVEKVATLKVRGFWGQLWFAIGATFTKGIRANLESALGKENFAQLPSGNQGKSLPEPGDGVINAGKVRWEDLKVADKEEIAQMTPRQVLARYGNISIRTARNWKTWIEQGK